MKNFLVLALMALALIPSGARACSCSPSATAQEEKDQSSRVFVGRVTSIEERTPQMDKSWLTAATGWLKEFFGEPPPMGTTDFPYRRISFLVSESFKGSPVSRINISAGMGGGDCGYFFDPGKEYVVYAYGEEDALETGICSLTGPASDPRSGVSDLRTGS